MKEIIDSLNIPKQILDKSEKLLSTLFGEGFKEIGGIFGDKMKLKRLKNQIDILIQANQIIEDRGLKSHQINLKTLVPLLEKSSLEEDKILQDKWAQLISNISTSNENGLEPKLVNTLSSLSTLEAVILDFLYETLNSKKEKIFTNSQTSSYKKYKTIDDIKSINISFSFLTIKNKFSLSYEFTKIHIDNLESLGIVKYEDPEIEIDKGFSDAEIIEDKNNNQSIDLNLDVSAKLNSSEDFYFTHYGLYFIKQCKSH